MTDASTESEIRVLIIDDDVNIRNVLRAVLDEKGCRCSLAADGRQALQELLRAEFDVAVVDIVMEVMDGYTFLDEALKICPWLGVIVITGYFDGDVQKRLDAIGSFPTLLKPLDFELLHRTVNAANERKIQKVQESGQEPLIRLQYQLNVLRTISETAIDHHQFVGALHHFCLNLATLTPSTVVSLLGQEAEQYVLIHTVKAPVTADALSTVESTMLRRFSATSGSSIAADAITTRIDGSEWVSADGIDTLRGIFVVPIIIEGAVIGVIGLSAPEHEAYSDSDRFFVYHAANHISMVLLAFGRLHHKASIDGLTGVHNRDRLEEELEEVWSRASRYGHRMAVIMVDIDHFKNINDTHGHLAGDRVLREFAGLVRECSRRSDFVGRYGGDELVILLPHSGLRAAEVHARRLLHRVREQRFCRPELDLAVTLSIGMASNETDTDCTCGLDILNIADKGLYRAKREGRDRFCKPAGVTVDSRADRNNRTPS